jgi:broad specificity phosphatase PhoE
LPLRVEVDLREWLPDTSDGWSGRDTPRLAREEMLRHGGEWPPGQTMGWEPLSKVRERVEAALASYDGYTTIVVACHGVVIHSLTGESSTPTGGIRPWPDTA